VLSFDVRGCWRYSFSNRSSSSSPDPNHVPKWHSVLSYMLTLPTGRPMKLLNWNTATPSKILRSRRLWCLDITGSLFIQEHFAVFSCLKTCIVSPFGSYKVGKPVNVNLAWKQAAVLMCTAKSLCLLANVENRALHIVSKDDLCLDSSLCACL